MDYAITLSFSARRDIQDIVRYISIDSPERAMEFGGSSRLQKQCHWDSFQK